jgi:hypothetical protein
MEKCNSFAAECFWEAGPELEALIEVLDSLCELLAVHVDEAKIVISLDIKCDENLRQRMHSS